MHSPQLYMFHTCFLSLTLNVLTFLFLNHSFTLKSLFLLYSTNTFHLHVLEKNLKRAKAMEAETFSTSNK